MFPRAPLASRDQYLRRRFFNPRLDPHQLVRDLLATMLYDDEQLSVARRLGALADDQPKHRSLLNRKMELAEIAEQEKSGRRGAANERRCRAPESREHALPRPLVDIVGDVAGVTRSV